MMPGPVAGYLHSLEVVPELQVSIFMQKQLLCLNKTPYQNRFLHFDATGSLVKISHQQASNSQVDYKHILSYFCLQDHERRKPRLFHNGICDLYLPFLRIHPLLWLNLSDFYFCFFASFLLLKDRLPPLRQRCWCSSSQRKSLVLLLRQHAQPWLLLAWSIWLTRFGRIEVQQLVRICESSLDSRRMAYRDDWLH